MEGDKTRPRLMEQVRNTMRMKHYNRRTEKAFRHSLATQLLQHGTDIRTVREFMGHKSVETTQIYSHVPGAGFAGVRSPWGAEVGSRGAIGLSRDTLNR